MRIDFTKKNETYTQLPGQGIREVRRSKELLDREDKKPLFAEYFNKRERLEERFGRMMGKKMSRSMVDTDMEESQKRRPEARSKEKSSRKRSVKKKGLRGKQRPKFGNYRSLCEPMMSKGGSWKLRGAREKGVNYKQPGVNFETHFSSTGHTNYNKFVRKSAATPKSSRRF